MRHLNKLSSWTIAILVFFGSTAHAVNLPEKQTNLAQCAVNYKNTHIIGKRKGNPNSLVKSKPYLQKCLTFHNLTPADYNKSEILEVIKHLQTNYPNNSPVILALKALIDPLSLKELLIMTIGETYLRIEDLAFLPADLQEAVRLYFPDAQES